MLKTLLLVSFLGPLFAIGSSWQSIEYEFPSERIKIAVSQVQANLGFDRSLVDLPVMAQVEVRWLAKVTVYETAARKNPTMTLQWTESKIHKKVKVTKREEINKTYEALMKKYLGKKLDKDFWEFKDKKAIEELEESYQQLLKSQRVRIHLSSYSDQRVHISEAKD